MPIPLSRRTADGRRGKGRYRLSVRVIVKVIEYLEKLLEFLEPMTEEEKKDKVQPLYEELQGYLEASQSNTSYYNSNSSFWTQLSYITDQLKDITGDDYSRFNVVIIRDTSGEHIEMNEYRLRLSGLIKNLEGKYFPTDGNLVSGSPGGVNVAVNQNQSIQLTIALEMSTLIDKQLYGEGNKNLTTEERTFLKKIKDALVAIQTPVQLLGTILNTANSLGLDVNSVKKLLGL